MLELFRRLGARPFITFELLIASLFANLLALASPLFVIQVLNRYVTYGIDATLATLTAGVIIALVLENGFRHARARLAENISRDRNKDLMIGAFGILATAKTQALNKVSPDQRQEILRGLALIETAYNSTSIAAILDTPFALLFVGVLFLLSPTLGIIVLLFLIANLIYGMVHQWLLQKHIGRLNAAAVAGSALVTTINQTPDSVRCFDHGGQMMDAWQQNMQVLHDQRQVVARRQESMQTASKSIQGLMSVTVVAVGAILVVMGELDVGMLIGANILSARALAPIARFAQLGHAMTKAAQALKQLNLFAALDVERDSGTALKHYHGSLSLSDVTFSYPGAIQSVFESLSVELPKGGVMVVTGHNGAGKTTLARLITGLVEPTHGKILADGVDSRQMTQSWWRQQLIYLPQEPSFLSGSIAENLMAANPNLDSETLNQVITDADLSDYIDQSPDGLDTMLLNRGQNLALGIRKRLALARALTTGGVLALFDEPTEGLDKNGCSALYSVLMALSKRGCTIIAMTDDPVIMQAARLVLDLNAKPVPRIINNINQQTVI